MVFYRVLNLDDIKDFEYTISKFLNEYRGHYLDNVDIEGKTLVFRFEIEKSNNARAFVKVFSRDKYSGFDKIKFTKPPNYSYEKIIIYPKMWLVFLSKK